LFLTFSWIHTGHIYPLPGEMLITITPESLASLLDENSAAKQDQVWPLSLLAFKQTIHSLALPRKQVENFKFVENFLADQKSDKSNIQSKMKCEQNSDDLIQCDLESELTLTKSASSTMIKKESGLAETSKFEFYETIFYGDDNVALKHIFRKHVKPKKQYELARLGKFTKDCMSQVCVDNLIDVGAGQGHLARYLCYAHSLQVACVDSNNDFTDSANKFDKQLEESMRRLERRGQSIRSLPPPPVHVNAYLDPDMDLQSFHSILAEKFQISNTELKYGIVGLHTCGDLGPVLLKMFTNDFRASALHSVGCCYMKVQKHFPMSNFTDNIQTNFRLTYTNAELACHAIEMYTDRLRANQQDKLKVHCYRAVLEKLLVLKDRNLSHSILKTVARAHELPFRDYAIKATSNLPFSIDPEQFDTKQIQEELSAWWEVVAYYTIRLALAPVIETVILLDRCIYLYENGLRSLLIPLFDPSLSPRNQIIFSSK